MAAPTPTRPCRARERRCRALTTPATSTSSVSSWSTFEIQVRTAGQDRHRPPGHLEAERQDVPCRRSEGEERRRAAGRRWPTGRPAEHIDGDSPGSWGSQARADGCARLPAPFMVLGRIPKVGRAVADARGSRRGSRADRGDPRTRLAGSRQRPPSGPGGQWGSRNGLANSGRVANRGSVSACRKASRSSRSALVIANPRTNWLR